MKSTIYQRLAVAITITALLAACSEPSANDKKTRLEDLKKQQVNIAKEIKALEQEITSENPQEETTGRVKEVVVREVQPRKFDHFVQTQGRVESENNILVSAKSMGVITQVFATEGQSVSKGQVLAQIDNSVILRNIESMKAQLDLAKSVFERQQNLWNQKIGTEVQYLQAKTNKESLEKQLASLQEQNEMTRIKAPINGTVDEVHVKVGENIAPGMPAVRVVNASDLKLVANVSEAYVTTIQKSNKVVVNIPELKKDIEAKVSFVGKTIDPLSRTFTVEVQLPENATLRPNMTASMKVVYQSEPSAIVVPVNIVQNINGEKVVYVAESNGKQTVAKRKTVQVAGVYDGLAQVDGIKSGEKVITTGYQGLNDGQLIKI